MNTDPTSLSNLHDIVEPGAIAPWPPAPGVWLLLLLVGIWLLAGGALFWLRWRQNAYRREALHALVKIKAETQSPESRSKALRNLGSVLKRAGLAGYARDRVASLSGDAWLLFLDETLGGREFSDGPGRLLPQIAYSRAEVSKTDAAALVSLAERWVRGHIVHRES